MQHPTVLFVTCQPTDVSDDALTAAGFEVIRAVGADGVREALAEGGRVDLAVFDAGGPAAERASIYELLHGERPIPTLVLIDEAGSALDGDHASPSDEYAMKPVAGEALVFRLQAMLIRLGRELPSESGSWASSESLSAAPVAGEGTAISVFAPKGGVGKTTIAVNLAVALRQQTRAQVLLFDADVGVGNVTTVLDVPFRIGLADLVTEEWTDDAFEQAVCIHGESGLRVLSWGSDPAEGERVSIELLTAALAWARRHHTYVVVDLHPGYDDRTMTMLALADELFLVVTPEVGSVRHSSHFIDLARQLNLGDRVRVIINRANHGIRLNDVATSLKAPVSATVVSNGPKAVMAANEGKPIILKFPKERISRDLHDVARLLTHRGEATAVERRRWRPRWSARPAASHGITR